MTLLAAAGAIASNDVRLELRRPVLLANMALFGAGALVAGHLVLSGGGRPSSVVATGAMWIVVLFAACLGATRAMIAEKERGTWSALLLAPADRTAIFVGKAMSTLTLVALMHLALIPVYAVTFAPHVTPSRAGTVVAMVLLFDVTLAALGALVGLVSMGAGARELLGPVLLLPLSLPPLLVAASATAELFDGRAGGHAQALGFLAAYAGMTIAAGVASFAELAVE